MSTINDVAKEAGVSITTVSRVLNKNYPVKEETRVRIEKAIEKLDYRPNEMARSLIRKKTSVIGVVVPGITNLFFPTIVEAIQNETDAKGYCIYLCNSGGNSLKEKELVDNIISRQVDGIIVIDPSMENLQNNYFEQISRAIPLIIVNGNADKNKCSYVCYDEEVGTLEAFEYLLELGHRKIAFVRGDKSVSYDIKEKIYREFLREKGIIYQEILKVRGGNSIEVMGNIEGKLCGLLHSEQRPTAFFCCNDLMAVGVVKYCKKCDLKVPEEISVIGFDNTLVSMITEPQLTSIDLNMREIGRKAASEILDIIENGTNHRKRIILDSKLIKRNSCGTAMMK